MQLMKFRLRDRCGQHIEGVPGDPTRETLVNPGEVFESPVDRATLDPGKFERMPDQVPTTAARLRGNNGTPLPGQAPPAPTPPQAPPPAGPPAARPQTGTQAEITKTLEAMTLDELKRYAGEENIQLGTAKTREQVLKVVKDATL